MYLFSGRTIPIFIHTAPGKAVLLLLCSEPVVITLVAISFTDDGQSNTVREVLMSRAAGWTANTSQLNTEPPLTTPTVGAGHLMLSTSVFHFVLVRCSAMC